MALITFLSIRSGASAFFSPCINFSRLIRSSSNWSYPQGFATIDMSETVEFWIVTSDVSLILPELNLKPLDDDCKAESLLLVPESSDSFSKTGKLLEQTLPASKLFVISSGSNFCAFIVLFPGVSTLLSSDGGNSTQFTVSRWKSCKIVVDSILFSICFRFRFFSRGFEIPQLFFYFDSLFLGFSWLGHLHWSLFPKKSSPYFTVISSLTFMFLITFKQTFLYLSPQL